MRRRSNQSVSLLSHQKLKEIKYISVRHTNSHTHRHRMVFEPIERNRTVVIVDSAEEDAIARKLRWQRAAFVHFTRGGAQIDIQITRALLLNCAKIVSTTLKYRRFVCNNDGTMYTRFSHNVYSDSDIINIKCIYILRRCRGGDGVDGKRWLLPLAVCLCALIHRCCSVSLDLRWSFVMLFCLWWQQILRNSFLFTLRIVTVAAYQPFGQNEGKKCRTVLNSNFMYT